MNHTISIPRKPTNFHQIHRKSRQVIADSSGNETSSVDPNYATSFHGRRRRPPMHQEILPSENSNGDVSAASSCGRLQATSSPAAAAYSDAPGASERAEEVIPLFSFAVYTVVRGPLAGVRGGVISAENMMVWRSGDHVCRRLCKPQSPASSSSRFHPHDYRKSSQCNSVFSARELNGPPLYIFGVVFFWPSYILLKQVLIIFHSISDRKDKIRPFFEA